MREPSRVREQRTPLVCGECGVESDEQARGWRALPVSEDDELPTREDRVEFFCPDCAAREFDSD